MDNDCIILPPCILPSLQTYYRHIWSIEWLHRFHLCSPGGVAESFIAEQRKKSGIFIPNCINRKKSKVKDITTLLLVFDWQVITAWCSTSTQQCINERWTLKMSTEKKKTYRIVSLRAAERCLSGVRWGAAEPFVFTEIWCQARTQTNELLVCGQLL